MTRANVCYHDFQKGDYRNLHCTRSTNVHWLPLLGFLYHCLVVWKVSLLLFFFLATQIWLLRYCRDNHCLPDSWLGVLHLHWRWGDAHRVKLDYRNCNSPKLKILVHWELRCSLLSWVRFNNYMNSWCEAMRSINYAWQKCQRESRVFPYEPIPQKLAFPWMIFTPFPFVLFKCFLCASGAGYKETTPARKYGTRSLPGLGLH